jgi:hypothetical protein
MEPKDFEDYMRGVHADDYHGTDDDMSDAFEAWVTDLDVEEWLKHGELYANIIKS